MTQSKGANFEQVTNQNCNHRQKRAQEKGLNFQSVAVSLKGKERKTVRRKREQ